MLNSYWLLSTKVDPKRTANKAKISVLNDLWSLYNDLIHFSQLWENLTNTDPLKASNVSRYSTDMLIHNGYIKKLISIIGKEVKNAEVTTIKNFS